MQAGDSIEALTQLGFTRLEAEIYTFLVQHPPATGYKVAKGAGKTNAITYKTLESLQAKGAAMADDGDPRIWRAVPTEELLRHLRRRFDRAQRRAEEALSRLEPAAADHRVYQITSREPLLERARRMLEECRWIALLDIYPPLEGELRDVVAATADRGIRVLVKLYRPGADFGRAEVIERRNGDVIVDAMPYDHLRLVTDGRQLLTSWLEPDDGPPAQGIWTASPVLAYEAYHSLMYEMILTDLQQAVWDGADNPTLVERLAHYDAFHPIRSRNPIYREYLAALGRRPDAEGGPRRRHLEREISK